jgi:hypothetical protein
MKLHGLPFDGGVVFAKEPSVEKGTGRARRTSFFDRRQPAHGLQRRITSVAVASSNPEALILA